MIRFGGEIISMTEGMRDKSAIHPVDRRDMHRRLTWLYGDAHARIVHNTPDVLKWHDLGRPK